MKIGIMTYWWSDENYGQVLQAYALQKYLREVGHNPYLIRYFPPLDYRFSWVRRNLKFLKLFIPSSRKEYLESCRLKKENKRRNIENFKKIYLKETKKRYSYRKLMKRPPCADVYITGSDQVWNTYSSGKKLTSDQKKFFHAFMLDFGASQTKKISYAASWGRESISEEEAAECKPLLEKFSYISVREKAGVSICNRLGIQAEVVVDPTLLFGPDDYRKLYSNAVNKQENSKYVLIYFRGASNFDINKIYEWACAKKLKVQFVPYNGYMSDKYELIYPSVEEWLYLIDNAEYVITDSFHCCLFSALFGKKYGVIKASDNFKATNSRFDSLFDLMKSPSRFISNEDYSKLELEPTPYDRTNILNYVPDLRRILD